MRMPASQTGFANLFLERNLRMSSGYQIPVLGSCPPGMGPQHPHHHLAGLAGLPLAYSGLQGYNFIPYSHHRHITHMNNSMELKAASPYHQALLARGGGPFYPVYRAGATEDPGRGAKLATRESTSALKAWLNEHLKNPYPTKGEKIMLAIVTKMSLTQVSTWFANARRRLKKENRVSWANKGKSDEEDEGESEEEEGEVQKNRLEEEEEEEIDPQVTDDKEEVRKSDSTLEEKPDRKELDSKEKAACLKPKIWSLAETAISETVNKTKDTPSSHQSPEVGKWWAEWAARNGIFIHPAYSATHDIL